MTKDQKIAKNAEEKGIPIFTLVAKDACSTDTLEYYYDFCSLNGCNEEFLTDIKERIDEFKKWQKDNPVKLPD